MISKLSKTQAQVKIWVAYKNGTYQVGVTRKTHVIESKAKQPAGSTGNWGED